MDKYRRVERPKEVQEDVKEKREVHVTSQGKMRNYISYTLSLFEEDPSKPVTLKAMGRAINKTVTIVEITKRRVVGLHQDTTIGSVDVKDTWEPLEEGLDVVVTSRHVSTISVVLSLQPLNPNSPGYQPPLPADQVQAEKANKIAMDDEYPEAPAGGEHGRGRGRGRGRGDGRGGRGRGGGGSAPAVPAAAGGGSMAGAIEAPPAPRGGSRSRGGGRGGQGSQRGGPRLRGVPGGERGRGRGPRRGGGAPSQQPPQS